MFEQRLRKGTGHRFYNLEELGRYLSSNSELLLDLQKMDISALQSDELRPLTSQEDLFKEFGPVDSSYSGGSATTKLKLYWPAVWYAGDLDSRKEPGILLPSEQVKGMKNYVWFDTGALISRYTSSAQRVVEHIETVVFKRLLESLEENPAKDLIFGLEFLVMSDASHVRVLVGAHVRAQT